MASPLAAYQAIKVFFDSGVHHARRGLPPRATLGFGIWPEEAEEGTEPLAASLASSELGGAIGYWHQDGLRFLEQFGEVVTRCPTSRAVQLYDLVAAEGAILHLRVNDYRGRARMISDGLQVVEFLNGRDRALRLEVMGQDLARTIRGHIRAGVEQLGETVWQYVPRKQNWVDPILKDLDRTRVRLRHHRPVAVGRQAQHR